LSNVYLVRHGQAGTRDAYDCLSDLGRHQAKLLGEYLAAQRLIFAAAYSGSMKRQQETALGVRESYRAQGIEFPEIVSKSEWDEFDLDDIYREIAPRMCDDDPDFRRQYETMRQEVHASHGEHAAAVHRRWLPCDSQLVKAWIAGKYSYNGESWDAFRGRVTAFRLGIENGDPAANVVVFTSAMPVAIWTGLALDIFDERILRLAAVLHNTSYGVLRLRARDLRLLSFNQAPHLSHTEIRTYR